MNVKFNKLAVALAAAALSAVATQASASTFIDLVNKNTTYVAPSVVTIDFGAVAADDSPTYTQGLATFTEGTLYTSSASSVTAQPVGSEGAFWSVGNYPAAQVGPGLLTFSTGVKYVGFLWGSPDQYNTVQFYNGGTLLAAVTGSIAPLPGNGNQAFSAYYNFFAEGADVVTSVKFISTSNAIETDNFAYSVTAVPEPESYALMLAGLGLMGTIARRRNKSKAA